MSHKTTPVPILCTFLVVIVSFSTGADRVVGQTAMLNRQGKLWKQDRQRLALALAKGESRIRLLIASEPGENRRVAEQIRSRGGTIEYQADEVDYLRVKVPVVVVAEIEQLAGIQGICINGSSIYHSLDDDDSQPSRTTGRKEDDKDVPTPPGNNVPADNPFVAMRDMGAPQFIGKHPTFDGRGVTIGVVEAAPDVLVPELQTARDLEGHAIRKIAGFADVMDPEDESGYHSPPSVDVHDEVHAAEGKFTYENVTYAAPSDGTFRFGFFNPKHVAKIAKRGEWKDLELYQDADGKPRPAAILCDESSGQVWVDVKQNHDFKSEKPLRDFNLSGDIGVFGHDVRNSVEGVAGFFPSPRSAATSPPA
jgi:hypothetical protein